MKLTKQSEVGVRILLRCACAPGHQVMTGAAAMFAGTTKDYAARIVAMLVHKGFLVSTRGRTGGIRLARPAGSMAIGEIIRLMEPSLGPAKCEDGKRSHTFDAVLRAATAFFLDTFDEFTIADLAREQPHGRVVCLDCNIRA